MVCKTITHRFDSGRRLQILLGLGLFGFEMFGLGGCVDPPDPPPVRAPADRPSWSTAPWVVWAAVDTRGPGPLAVFVGPPGGAMDQIAADADVTTFLNDRFVPLFVPSDLAPDLPEGAFFLNAEGCVLDGPWTPQSAADWISHGNAVLLALDEGQAHPYPLDPAPRPERWGFRLHSDAPLNARCGRSGPSEDEPDPAPEDDPDAQETVR